MPDQDAAKRAEELVTTWLKEDNGGFQLGEISRARLVNRIDRAVAEAVKEGESLRLAVSNALGYTTGMSDDALVQSITFRRKEARELAEAVKKVEDKARLDRVAAARENERLANDVAEARREERQLIRAQFENLGLCRLLSQGDHCTCPLCIIDALDYRPASAPEGTGGEK